MADAYNRSDTEVREICVLSDVAVGYDRDLLNFGRYVDILLDIMTNPNAETPFTIGIFGSWGSGKSSLLRMLDEKLTTDYRERFIQVHFNPWIHRGESNMLIPLLHTLHDTLLDNNWQDTLTPETNKKLQKSAEKISTILLKLGTDILLKHLTADTISLETLENLENSYNKKRQELESKIRSLRKEIQSEFDDIAADNVKIVLFIDDLDRCEPTEIINLLEAIKLFLDLRHVFIILAIDKEVIDRGIEVKYKDFKFAQDRSMTLGAEYLEKMIQLPLQLFPLGENQVRGFMEALNLPNLSPVIREQLDVLEKIVVPNPRKIKRIVNILKVINAIIKAAPKGEKIKLDLMTRLIVLQVQNSELYNDVIKQPQLLIALENVYKSPAILKKPEEFEASFINPSVMQKLCEKYYYADNRYLKELFIGATFSKVKEELSIYLTLLGG